MNTHPNPPQPHLLQQGETGKPLPTSQEAKGRQLLTSGQSSPVSQSANVVTRRFANDMQRELKLEGRLRLLVTRW